MLENKIIVVTGGAGLLGKVFCECIIRNGGHAVIADINEESAAAACLELTEITGSGNISSLGIDISSRESLISGIKKTSKAFGRIDAWVNNAYPRNKNYGRRFFEVEYQDFCENLNLNLGGYFLASQQIAIFFKQQGFGNIVNISSIYGLVAPRFEIYDNTTMTMPVEYAVIKSGLLHLTKFMAKQFKGLNIRVNAISPGGIFDQQPEAFLQKYKEYCLNKGILDKTDIQGTLLYLLSDLSRFVNGQNIIVDDGFTL